MGEIRIRGELLNELLEKRVTSSDIKRHNLNEDELKILYMSDFIDVQEFVHIYRQNNPCAHLKSAHKQWSRELEKKAKFFVEGDLNGFSKVVFYSIRYGIDKKMLHTRLRGKEIPTYRYYSSLETYVRELLSARDSMYEFMMSVEEVAKFLNIKPRQFRNLAKQYEITISNGMVSTLDLSDYLWSKISRECELLMRILPKRLENFFKSWKLQTAVHDSEKCNGLPKSLSMTAKSAMDYQNRCP